jgi:copper homeostasis protein CutC
MIIEICCDGIEAAKKAVEAGAKRIELCSDLSIGGITPPYSEIEEAAAKLGTAVNVLVRPRGGDFVYNEAEMEKMLREIAFCGGAGVNGVVIGALTPEGKIDVPLCREFVSMARSYGLEITFHRAIDEAIAKALSLVPGTEIPQSSESPQHTGPCSIHSLAHGTEIPQSSESPQHIGPCSIHSLAHGTEIPQSSESPQHMDPCSTLSLAPDPKNLQSPEELSPAVLGAIKEVLEDVFNLGVERILSSGGAPDAYAGRVVLGAMRRFAEEWAAAHSPGAGHSRAPSASGLPARAGIPATPAPSRGPIIMAGGGVTPQNAKVILDASGVSELHGSRLFLLDLQ